MAGFTGQGDLGRALFHAGAGCISAAADGGNCGRGAVSAGTTKYLGANFIGEEGGVSGLVKWTVLGGTVSKATGGTFANGAMTASFQYLFNECGATRGCSIGRNDTYSGSTPILDSSGRLVVGGDGQPVLVPEGTDMASFAAEGRNSGLVEAYDKLKNFAQGGAWDLQRQAGVFQPRYVDGATVAIGVYSAAAGIPLSVNLTLQNEYARQNSTYPPNTQMHPIFRSLPVRNVVNTQIGYDLVKSGRY